MKRLNTVLMPLCILFVLNLMNHTEEQVLSVLGIILPISKQCSFLFFRVEISHFAQENYNTGKEAHSR